ncbi:MAG TPA: DUF488 family protein [Methylomirabilota bacterium]|nr:DUF488 family protein [Methylomirabilota bacterium]
MVGTKRAYETPGRSDGYRVLIDRLWPRGARKERLALVAWAKELAPSGGLRRWFAHDPDRWKGFVERYRRELRASDARERLDDLARRAARDRVTVVYGARDEQHDDAVVVRDEIARRLRVARRRPARRLAGRSRSRVSSPR